MREANWDEIFQRRRIETTAKDERLNTIVPWEDWLTFIITTVLFMSVVASIDSAHWVSDMPSLYPIGFSALVVGYGLSRVRWNAIFLYPIALFLGATLVFFQLMAIISGHSLYVRTDHLLDRMYVWWSAVTQNGLSSDSLPVIVLMLVLTWLGTYASAWAIFRWRNAWLGVIPGGTALMWNISFIPGQFSPAFIVFVFAAVLLLMRLHLSKRELEWDRSGVHYPEFISLSVLNATFWVTVGLLVFVWLMPVAARSDSANQRWKDFTAPVTRHLTPLARVFISINAKKPINIHNIKDALAFQGKINFNDNAAVKLDVKLTPEMAAFLREQSFDQYTSSGWRVNVDGDVPLAPGTRDAVPPPAVDGTRQDVTINVTVEGGNNDHLFSLGQPVQSDTQAVAPSSGDGADVTSLKPSGHLSDGDKYTVTGSVNVASLDQLEASGTSYPQWVTDRYLSLPDNLPRRVRSKAREVVRGQQTPYDKAASIERYLRTFPTDYNVPETPAGRDSVDFFLFDLQRGYFDYHASAMAVMLRSLGIPARVASGYVVDPAARDGTTDTFKLTQQNAYAWPEVYFAGIGWVEFSPAPAEPLIRRPGSPQDAQPPTGSRLGIDPNEPPLDLGINPLGGAPLPTATAASHGGSSMWGLWIALAIVAGVIVVLGAAGRVAWEYGLGGLSQPARLWEKTVRLSTLGKLRPRPSETPREFAARLRRDVPGTEGAGYLAEKYERNRFGQKDLTDDEAEQLDSAWASLRANLLRRALRLKPRRSP